MKWEEKYNVKFYDTNMHEMLSVSNVLRFMQETAMRNMKSRKPSYEELFGEKKAFILSNIRIEMYSPIYAYEDIVAKSWACESRGYSFMRSYSIERNGEIMAEAYSTWALVSTEERKLYRVTDVDLSNYDTDEPVQLENPLRIRIPSAVPLSLVGEYTVRYSDIDLNGHMNNSYYPDMIINALPSPERLIVKSIGISFINDIKCGETVKLYITKTDGKYYFRSVKNDGSINVEAEVIAEIID
jgi:acyl-ACP thioesterase